jgi:HAD superfamily hydrolase (TIGR01509 family)
VLLDIDGTLVDSNFLHVEAWARTFADLGLTVPAWRIQRSIGADSAELLGRLLGDETDDVRNRAKELHTTHYRELVPRLRVLPGARELISDLHARGVRIVLATSAPADELESLLDLLDIGDETHAVTSSEDVETAKPDPGIIAVALEKGGVSAENAIMIGDSTWDVTAAGRAGVRAVGLLSGGTGEDDLMQAGAVAVYDDAEDLRAHLGDSVLADLVADAQPERTETDRP